MKTSNEIDATAAMEGGDAADSEQLPTVNVAIPGCGGGGVKSTRKSGQAAQEGSRTRYKTCRSHLFHHYVG